MTDEIEAMQETETLQDGELLNAFTKRGTSAAFETLVRRHAARVFASAYRQLRDRQLAEDATQTVFLLLFKKAAHMRPDHHLCGWLFRTVGHACNDLRRSRDRGLKYEKLAAQNATLSQDSQDNGIAADLDAAVARLPDGDRELVLLRFFQSMEFEQVASTLQISEAAVRKRLTRSIQKLRAMLNPTVSAETLGAIAMVGHAQAPVELSATIVELANDATQGTAVAIGNRFLFYSKLKTAAVVLFAFVVAAIVPIFWRHSNHSIPKVLPVAQQLPPVVLPKQSFQARCTDAAGKSIAGAQVYLAQTIGHSHHDRLIQNLVVGPIISDSTGVAKFDDVPAPIDSDVSLNRTLYARIPNRLVGFASQYWDNDQEDPIPAALDIKLLTSTTIHGTIKVPAGFKPESVSIKTASIDLNSDPIFGEILWRQSNPTDGFLADIYDIHGQPDGSFSIADIPIYSNTYLIARTAGLAETTLRLTTPAPAAVFDIHPQSVIHGRITLPDGKPAADIAIEAQSLGASNIMVNTRFGATTNAKGEYSIDQLPGAAVALRLVASEKFAMAPKAISLTTAETVEANLSLQTGTLVTGHVLDPDGHGLVDIEVAAQSSIGGGVLLNSVSTDSSGTYTLRLPAGQFTMYIASSVPHQFIYPKNAGSNVVSIPDKVATMKGPSWTLSPNKPGVPFRTATLQGRVVDERGVAVPNLPMTDSRVENWNGKPMPVQTNAAATTGVDGRFTIKVQAGIRHTVLPSSPEFDAPETAPTTPKPDQIVTLDDLVVHARPIITTVTGIVVDSQGRPLEGVLVSGQSDQRNSDVNGHFEMPIRSSDPYIGLMMSKPGYRYRGWGDIPSGTKDIRLTMITSPDSPLDYNAKSKAPDPKSLIGADAPALHVDWVLLPSHQPPSIRHDGAKQTVILFASDFGKPEEMQKTIADLEKTCARFDALLIVIFNPGATDAGIRARFADHVKTARIGIDQFLADSNPNDVDGATAMSYGINRRGISVYIVEDEGTIQHVLSDSNGLESRLFK